MRAFAALALTSSILGQTLVGCLASTSRDVRKPPPPRLTKIKLEHANLILSVPRTLAAHESEWLEDALAFGVRQLAMFELALGEPVLVRLHASVATFVNATGQTDAWLRAWSSFATVDLLALSYWDDRSRAAQRRRLSHELCHCALFQAFGSVARARDAKVPWWFLEGMASVVAEQGQQRMPLPTVLARTRDEVPFGVSLGGRPQALIRDHDLAYGAAHHLAAKLVELQGITIFSRVLVAAAKQGDAGAIEAALLNIADLSLNKVWLALRNAPSQSTR